MLIMGPDLFKLYSLCVSAIYNRFLNIFASMEVR